MIVEKMYGSISSETLREVYNFARCMRPDGTYYGTSGKCRKGSLVGAKEEAAKGEARGQIELKQKNLKEGYATLLKKQQELFEKGDVKGAMALGGAITTVLKKLDNLPEAKEKAENLKKEFEARLSREKEFKKAQKLRDRAQLNAGLTDTDKKALRDYTKETGNESPRSYTKLNDCFRTPSNCPDPQESVKFSQELDSALSKLPKNPKGTEFYRGITVYPGEGSEKLYKSLSEAKPGTTIKDFGYGSYSAERRQAERFTNRNRPNIIIVSRNKEITPINMFSLIKEENEAILPRGIKQTIQKVTRDGNNLIVELE